MRLVFSRCAPAQRHLTWDLKQNTCEPCNASTASSTYETTNWYTSAPFCIKEYTTYVKLLVLYSIYIYVDQLSTLQHVNKYVNYSIL